MCDFTNWYYSKQEGRFYSVKLGPQNHIHETQKAMLTVEFLHKISMVFISLILLVLYIFIKSSIQNKIMTSLSTEDT